MVDTIIQNALEQSIKLAIVPIETLADMKADMELLAQQNELNKIQKWIVNDRYILDAPKVDFTPKSVVVAVWQLKLAEATFHYRGKKSSCIIEDAYTNAADVHEKLQLLFLNQGFSLQYIHWMPQKRFAVRSGLCEYGRNNITYCGDWGSFIRIGTYVSDIVRDKYFWRDVVNMHSCESCGKCIENCPTNAILPDRFLINSEICLAELNGHDDRDIPDWVPKSAHHRLMECVRCQDICPMNKKCFDDMEQIEFDENETNAILSSETFADFPKSVREKLWYYDTGKSFKAIPRNLKLMLDNAK